MSKKILTGVLIISHLLCVLLGYSIAVMCPNATNTEQYLEQPVDVMTTELPEEATQETEEQTVEITITEETSELTEVIEENVPQYTQAANKQSQATNPPETTPPDTVPTVPQPFDSNLGKNEMPPAIRGD